MVAVDLDVAGRVAAGEGVPVLRQRVYRQPEVGQGVLVQVLGTRSSIAFSQSLDGAFTWSAPVKVNQTPTDVALGHQQAFTPMVDVSSDGTVGVSYYDFRNNPADPAVLGTDAFLAHCHPATTSCADPDSWGEEVRLSDATFDMGQAPVARGFFTGDYEGLDVAGTDFFPLWSMPHGSDPSSVSIRRVTP